MNYPDLTNILAVHDYAVAMIVKQGRPSLHAGGGCRYRTQHAGKTLKCVAGWLIPDEHYTTDFEAKGFERLDLPCGAELLPAITEHIVQLQKIHDHAASNNSGLDWHLRSKAKFLEEFIQKTTELRALIRP